MAHERLDELVGKDLTVDTNLSTDWQNVRVGVTPCLVSTSTIWLLRQRRLLTGDEALALQGFSFKFLQECDPPLTCSEKMDLAGNAFNGATVMSLLFAIFVACDWAVILRQMKAFNDQAIPRPAAGAAQAAQDGSSD
eukprot:7688541-Pyramimonas_sp.AAC.1